MAELLAFNQRNEVHAVDLVDFVDDGDIGMLERGRSLGLLDEAALAVGVGDELGWQDLRATSRLSFRSSAL